jgi:branched-chain amino acid transport system ATP-binding protein
LDKASADNPIALAAGNIRLSFGRIQVLDDVSFDIKQDEILSIIGPNGAGKTSLMNCL